MSNLKTRLSQLYNGVYYPILVVLLVFVGHVTEFDIAFIAAILITLIPGFFVCNSVRFATMPILSVAFTVAIKDYKPSDHGFEERFLNAGTLITGGITGALLVFAIVYFLIKNRKSCNRLPRTGLWLGLAVFCGVMLTNGGFSQKYTPMNLLYAILISATILGIYLLFAFYTKFDSGTVDYFMYCFVLAGLVISAELIYAYFTTVQFDANGVVKGSVVLGWGIWTAIGGMLAFLMPACFYFAASHKHGWIAYLLGLLEFFCIVLSQSRAALLFGAIALALCVGYLLFKGKNRKQNRIITLVLFVIGVIGVIILKDKILTLFENLKQYGTNDNGRTEKWLIGWNHFLDYPILGSGFYDSFDDSKNFQHAFDPYLYHNNLIQMLAAGGIIGLLAYLLHRVQTVILLVRRPNTQKYFIAAALIAFLGFNLLDVLFFKFYPGFFYALMLLCAEHSEQKKTE